MDKFEYLAKYSSRLSSVIIPNVTGSLTAGYSAASDIAVGMRSLSQQTKTIFTNKCDYPSRSMYLVIKYLQVSPSKSPPDIESAAGRLPWVENTMQSTR